MIDEPCQDDQVDEDSEEEVVKEVLEQEIDPEEKDVNLESPQDNSSETNSSGYMMMFSLDKPLGVDLCRL